MKTVTVTFEVEDEEYDEFIQEHGDLNDWFYGEVCQNWGFGFITGFSVEDAEE